jgi:hypothetical protein
MMVVIVLALVQDLVLVTATAKITLVLDHAIQGVVVVDTVVRDRDRLIVIVAGQDLLADAVTTTSWRHEGGWSLNMDGIKRRLL